MGHALFQALRIFHAFFALRIRAKFSSHKVAVVPAKTQAFAPLARFSAPLARFSAPLARALARAPLARFSAPAARSRARDLL